MSQPRALFPEKYLFITGARGIEAKIAQAKFGYLRCYFNTIDDAHDFLVWANKQSVRNIHYAEIDLETNVEGEFVFVRLKEHQFKALVDLKKLNNKPTQNFTGTFLNQLILELPNLGLTKEEEKDAFKILNCARYIRDNIDALASNVDRKHDINVYKIKKGYTSKQTGQYVENDKVKGVFRDDKNTAFHIELFNNGNEFKAEYDLTLQELENEILKPLYALGQSYVKRYAKKLYFDPKTPCFNGRFERANSWAKKVIKHGAEFLDDILQDCIQEYGKSKEGIFEFAKKYCQGIQLQQCILDNKKIKLTDEILLARLKSVFPEEFEEEEKVIQEEKTEQKQSGPAKDFNQALKKAKNIALSNGMIEVHFENREDADQLCLGATFKPSAFYLPNISYKWCSKQSVYACIISPLAYEELTGLLTELLEAIGKTKRGKLIEIYDRITSKNDWCRLTLFGKHQSKIPPTVAAQIRDNIQSIFSEENALRSGITRFDLWEKAYEEVKALLDSTINTPSKTRYPETQNLYQSFRQSL